MSVFLCKSVTACWRQTWSHARSQILPWTQPAHKLNPRMCSLSSRRNLRPCMQSCSKTRYDHAWTIFAQKNAKPMSRNCETDVTVNAKPMSGWMRSPCHDNAKPMSGRIAKPMSNRMRSRCQDECEADVMIMRSRCQGECEADVKTNAKPMSRRPRSRCREGTHTRTRRMEVHTHTNKLTPNGNTQWDMFYFCLQWLLGFLLSR